MALSASSIYNGADALSQLEPTLTSLTLYFVIYDSAPLITRLDNTDTNYRVDPSPIVYSKNPFCKPFRLVTAVSEARGQVTVRVQLVIPSTNTPPSVAGFINPISIINTDRQSTFPVLNTIRYSDFNGAAAAIYNECIGKHIAIVRNYGNTTLVNPRFSGTYVPFSYAVTTTFPEVTNYNVYPTGFDSAVATTTGSISPLQITPFLCRPINDNRDSIASFESLMRMLVSSIQITVGNFSQDNQTNVEMYKIVQSSLN